MRIKLCTAAIILTAPLISHVALANYQCAGLPVQPGNSDYIRLFNCQISQYLNGNYSSIFFNKALPKSSSGTKAGNQNVVASSLNATQQASTNTNAAVVSALYTPDAEDVIAKNAENFPKTEQDAEKYRLNFSVASILGQENIGNNSSQEQEAQNFIKIISGQTNPITRLPKNWLESDNTAVQTYMNELATYAATQSVGINTFSKLLQERVEQSLPANMSSDSLANKELSAAGIKLTPSNKMSPLALDHYLATRRVVNNKWYDQIQREKPQQLQQENLILLAEIRYEMFQQRMVTEQLTATLAAMQLQLQQTINKAAVARSGQQASRSIGDTSGTTDGDTETGQAN